jgi:hypothetical protein
MSGFCRPIQGRRGEGTAEWRVWRSRGGPVLSGGPGKTAGSSGVSDLFRKKDGGRIPGAAMFSLAAVSEVLLERAGGNGLGVLSAIRCKCSGFPLSLYHREEC